MRALVWHLRDAEEREHVDRALSGRRAPPVRSGRDGGGEVRRREPDQPPRAPTKPDLRTYPVADRPSSNLSKISLAPDHTKRPNQTPPANLSPPSRESTPPTGGEGRAAAGAWSSCRGRGWRPRWPSRSPSSPWPPAPPTSSSAAGSPGVSRASAAANNPRVSRELVALPTVQQPLARELPGGCLAPPPCPLIRISGLSIGFSC